MLADTVMSSNPSFCIIIILPENWKVKGEYLLENISKQPSGNIHQRTSARIAEELSMRRRVRGKTRQDKIQGS